MELSTLFDLASNRADAWNMLWQLYIAVSTGGLAIVVASSTPLTKRSTCIICVSFLLFLIGNYRAFSDYSEVRVQIHKMISTTLEKDSLPSKSKITDKEKREISKLSDKMGPPAMEILGVKLFYYFYWVLGILVLSGLWFIPKIRREKLMTNK